LHSNASLRFHEVDNEQLIAYSKSAAQGEETILTVVNLDVHHTQRGWVSLPLDQWKLGTHEVFQCHELLTGARYLWSGPRNYVELVPGTVPAHILRLRRYVRTEHDFDYFL
jgi:starch synthase (maltosyl-transferring)